MERKDGKKNEEKMRIRMSTELLNRIKATKEPAGWGEEADSSFARHLIVLGVSEVEQALKEKQAGNEARYELAAKKTG